MMDRECDAFQALLYAPQETLQPFLSQFLELPLAECAFLSYNEQQQQRKMEEKGEPGSVSTHDASAKEDGEPVFEEIMGFLNRLRDQRANESADNPECTRNDDGKSPSLDKVPNAFFEAEDIDSVVLDESAACVTSTMRAFFNYDIADVVPKVDNYFDGTGLTGEGEPDGRGDWQPDELVGGAPDNSEMGPQNGTGCAVVAEASSKRHVDPDTNCDAYFTTTVDESGDYSSSNSSYGEIELPGFDGFGKPPHHLTGAVQWDQQFLSWGNGHFLSREDVATLRTDGDEVRPFSVDPYFDYDAIVVGKSVRPFPYLSA